MTNNIFVPQTFNGERMVNVNLPNRRVGSQPANENTTNSPSTSLAIATTAAVAATRLRTAPAVAAAAAAASASSAGSPSSGNNTIENTSPNTKHLKPQTSPPSATQFIITTPIDSPGNKNDEVCVQKYWSEANIAILIQLHRKYYNGISSDDTKQSIESWTQLTKEYNSITCDDRSKNILMKRWGKVMRKYNAERSCLLVQQQKSSIGSSSSSCQQQMPMVSYWNHFQYMDGYLSHLSIPEDSLYIKKKNTDEESDYDEVIIDQRKRQFDQVEPILDDKLRLLEKQRLVMEQTLSKQQNQIDMMKKNYDSMNKMNMKFVDMCEKVTSKNQTNESRYLDLLEKYMDNKLLEKTKDPNTVTVTKQPE